MRMRHIIICGLPGSTVIFHIISCTALFKKKEKVTEHALISCKTFFMNHFSLYEKFREILPEMYIGLHVKYPLFWSDVN